MPSEWAASTLLRGYGMGPSNCPPAANQNCRRRTKRIGAHLGEGGWGTWTPLVRGEFRPFSGLAAAAVTGAKPRAALIFGLARRGEGRFGRGMLPPADPSGLPRAELEAQVVDALDELRRAGGATATAAAAAENPLAEGLERLPIHPTTLVIFGATGDLASASCCPRSTTSPTRARCPSASTSIGVSRRTSRTRSSADGERGDHAVLAARRPTTRCWSSCSRRSATSRARSTTTTVYDDAQAARWRSSTRTPASG